MKTDIFEDMKDYIGCNDVSDLPYRKREVWEEIKPPKGYYVDEDTVRMYEHAILGVECKEYILISLDGPAKGKRGKLIRPEKVYQTDKQLSMEEMAF